MMEAWLTHSGEILKTHTASEFTKGMAVIAHALQRSRGEKKGKAGERSQAQAEVEQLLSQLREGLEPVGG